MSCAVEILSDRDELAGLVEDWWSLWERAPAASPFQTPAWLGAWWSAFHPGRLHVLAVRSGGMLVGLAPFYIEDGSGRALPIGISISDYLDILIDPAASGEALTAISSHISGSGVPHWLFPDLPPESAALDLPCPAGFREAVEPSDPCPVLAIGSGPDPLGGNVPARQLRKLRMAQNRAGRRGRVRARAVGAGEISQFLDLLIDLHGKRWGSRGEAGVLADPRLRLFHEAALPALAERGLAHLKILEIGGRAVGAYYGLRSGQHAYAYLGGFDPDDAFESPGTILIGAAIADAAEAGAGAFHFLRGGEPYKYAWGAEDRRNCVRTFRRGAHR
ncbi:GNAT family N-acetyltransferase [Faunimonas sp. B44]|uniref:GNAT family N-acetyltransferase n=1 Tax=Faunimonas sp. B44 TaxID=3461493 RepID=UPI004044CE97